jgi:hypothetical protein
VTKSYAKAIDQLTAPGTWKFDAAKKLLAASEQSPAALYPHFAAFRKLLRADNKIIQWTAIRIIANLASVDKRGRIPRVLGEYLALIDGPVMVTAANTIAGAAKIASARPRLAAKITRAILRVERAHYQTAECRNVSIGQAITALGTMGVRVTESREVVRFLKRQLKNSRPSTRKKAVAFLKQL